MSKWYDYLWNPIGALGNDLFGQGPKSVLSQPQVVTESPVSDTDKKLSWSKIGDFLTGIWNDITGKSQIELQNKLNREMAEEEYQRNLQSIGDTASAYEAAGFNRNIMYSSGSSPVSYAAPNLQAYSGTAKLDTILNRVGKVLQFIPAMYSATAALEGIDQAREATKQSEIKTMSLGMDLLNKGFSLGDKYASKPFRPVLERGIFGNRHFLDNGDFTDEIPLSKRSGSFGWNDYQSASIKNTFELLKAIGIRNELANTRNAWLGYQYDLDRRFGAAGRVIGMSAQGLGSIGRAFKDFTSLKKPKGFTQYPSGAYGYDNTFFPGSTSTTYY